jgi:hypothetical protein
MFDIKYGQHGMKTALKPKTGSLRSENDASRFMESSRVPCWYNVSFESFIQSIMVRGWKLGSLG